MYKIGNVGHNKNKKCKGIKMTFIGMISDHKSFDKVKEELKEPQLELININKKV